VQQLEGNKGLTNNM